MAHARQGGQPRRGEQIHRPLGHLEGHLGIARAQVHQAEAAYQKILNGSRAQERGESAAAMRQAEAVEASARADWDRRQKLFDAGVISRRNSTTTTATSTSQSSNSRLPCSTSI